MRCSGKRLQQHKGATAEDERSRKALEHRDTVEVRRSKARAGGKKFGEARRRKKSRNLLRRFAEAKTRAGEHKLTREVEFRQSML